MRVLFVVEYFYPHIGGVETFFLNHCKHLVKLGHKPIVATTKHKSSLADFQEFNGIEIHRLPTTNRYFFTFFGFYYLLRKKLQFDIIHTTSYNAALPAFLLGRIKRKPILITFHEYWKNLWFNLPFISKLEATLYFLFEQFILSLRFDSIVAVSDFTVQRLSDRVDKRRLTRVYNGLDYNFKKKFRTESSGKGTFQLIYFGRLGISKGLDVLLDSLKQLKPTHAEKLMVTIVVPKESTGIRKKIHSIIKSEGLQRIVVFRESLPTESLLGLLKHQNAVVIPSYSEGFGYVAAECSALGIPIIHSGRGALSETVSGRYIKMEDFSAYSLAKAIVMGMQGKWTESPIRYFPQEEASKHYVDLYAHLCQPLP